MDLPRALGMQRALHSTNPQASATRMGKCICTNAKLRSHPKSGMSSSSNIEDRQRAHVERMLLRAEKRSRQAQKIVEKWKAKLMALDRAGVAAKQARLWQEEHLHEIE